MTTITTSQRVRRWVMPIVLAITGPALADDQPDQQHDIAIIPAECAAYWSIPSGDDSPASDAVTTDMVSSAHQMASLLRRDWSDVPTRGLLLAFHRSGARRGCRSLVAGRS